MTRVKRSATEGFTKEKLYKSDVSEKYISDLRKLRYLLSFGGPLDINLARIVVESDKVDSVECVELLSRDPRVDWSRMSETGDTPLMFCIKNNKTEMVEIIGGIRGIRSTVTESGLSFMKDFVRKKLEDIVKQPENKKLE